jgi:small subunit ribosomal protein S1
MVVLAIENDFVLVDVGLKSEGRIALREFMMGGHAPELKPGDTVEVFLERMEGPRMAKPCCRAKKPSAKKAGPSAEILRQGAHVTGIISGRVKGGFTVDLNGAAGVPAGQPGRYPPGARYHAADGHAAAFPDPENGSRARQHRGLAPRRARRKPRRSPYELVANLKEGQV